MRTLIINADDLGLSPEVNAAVETAHRSGILTSASLMVGEPALAEAVALARRNPRLAIGLHVALTDATPVLPAAQLPALTGPDGRFRDDMAGIALTLATSRSARAQLRAEVAAQVAAFRATGLPPDHVNLHKHFHLFPIIAAAVFAEARAAGITRTRVPYEPPALVGQGRGLATTAHAAGCALLRRLAAHHGLTAPDRVIGLAWSGTFTTERLAAVLPRLPDGTTELYFHPATRGGFPGAAPGYDYPGELAALTAPEVRAALAATGARTSGYA